VIDAIEGLLAEAESLPDPRARGLAKALATAMVELCGAGLRKAVEVGGPSLERQLANDALVGNLMVLCAMHPDPPVVRAERALRAAGIACTVTAAGQGVRVELEMPAERAQVEAIVMSRAPDAETIAVVHDGVVLAPEGFVPVERLLS
jgi:hypothetical protein